MCLLWQPGARWPARLLRETPYPRRQCLQQLHYNCRKLETTHMCHGGPGAGGWMNTHTAIHGHCERLSAIKRSPVARRHMTRRGVGGCLRCLPPVKGARLKRQCSRNILQMVKLKVREERGILGLRWGRGWLQRAQGHFGGDGTAVYPDCGGSYPTV